MGYNIFNNLQAVKGRVSLQTPFREPRLVGWGTEEMAEHGPGAAQAIGSLRRVRPLTRRRVLARPEASAVTQGRIKVVTRLFFNRPCVCFTQGRFSFFLRGTL